jgi:hypothetical protein
MMRLLRPATLLPSAFVSAALVATFAQCGDGKASTAPAVRAGQQDPKPNAAPPPDRLRILVSGAMHGRLEPCGCASGQFGGLPRRVQHIAEQRNYDLLLEGGDLMATATPLDTEKLLTVTQVLFGEHRYDALGVGPLDLNLPPQDLNDFFAGQPLVASDLVAKDDKWPGQPFLAKTVRGIAVRIASLTLALPDPARDGARFQLLAPAAAWQRALEGADAATRRIVMLHGSEAAIRAAIPLLQPPPDLAVGVDPGYVEPTPSPTLVGAVPLVFSGTRGRVLLDVWLHRDDKGPHVACELVPLAGSKTVPGGGGDPNVRQALLEHRNSVKNNGILAQMVRQVPTASGASYVGSSQCKVCHAPAYETWTKSKHFLAWETLEKAEKDEKRYGWPVTAYPDCVSCHVVGYREQSGFVSHEETPDLENVGCERCHGPASEHIAAPGKKKLGLIGGIPASQLCIQCHDYEQSPTFVYGERWPKIQHGK